MITFRFTSFFAFFPILILLSGQTALSEESMRFAISDLLADTVTASLEELSETEELGLSIRSMGSLPALERLRTGNIDLAIMAFPKGSEIPRSEFSIYPFAYAASIVAVNENNPLDEISLSRLAGIFGTSEEYNFTTWGDIGLSGWGSRKIKPLSGHTEGSIALELFKHSVLVEGSLKPSVDIVLEEEVIDLLDKDPALISVLSRIPEESSAKILLLASDDNSPAYGPTDDNIHFGDYPIRLTFYIVGPKSESSQLGQILRFMWSDEMSEQLTEEGFFALPETVRRKLTMDLDMVSSESR
jgi:ABC-type phosphate transport system substrate-binding protein